jgi:hypothetical protein
MAIGQHGSVARCFQEKAFFPNVGRQCGAIVQRRPMVSKQERWAKIACRVNLHWMTGRLCLFVGRLANCVEDAVDEFDGIRRREAAGKLQRFVDNNGGWSRRIMK